MRLRSLLLGSLILAGGGRVWAADTAPNEEAKRAFAAGVILLKDPDGAKYEDALNQFNKAYRLSGSWKALGNVGLCSLKLERDGEAIAAYEKYLAEGGKEIDGDERAQVGRDLAALRAQVVEVHLEYPAGASRIVDERISAQGARIVNDYALGGVAGKLGLHPGQHLVTLKLAQGEAKWEVKLDPGTSASHRFEVPSPVASPDAPAEPPASRGARTAGFVVGGVGVVGLGLGAFFGLKTFSDKKDSDPHCVGTECDQQGLDLRDRAKSASTISNIAFAAGLAGVAVGTYLVFFTGAGGAKPGSGVALGSRVGAGTAGLELRGAW
jgi:hypothetical protein